MEIMSARHLKKCATDTSGSVAVIFALTTTVVLSAVGLAIDYGRAASMKSKLQKASDAAALAAVDNPFGTTAEAQSLVLSYLAANRISESAATVSVSRSGTDVSVSVELSVPSTFLAIVGIKTIPVKASSVASQPVGTLEVYSAIDMSGSMGVAADAANRAAYDALQYPYSGRTCMFACHQRDGWEPAGMTSYDMAKAAGIRLREDVLTDSFSAFTDTFLAATDPAVAANYLRLAVIGFSDDAQLLQPPTNDAALVKQAPATFPYASRQNTRYSDSFRTIKSIVGTQGAGFAGSTNKVLLLITDGVGYDRVVWNSPYAGPIHNDLCQQFKDDGIKVAVIEVKYPDSTGQADFDWDVKYFYPQISPALKDCASPGLYFLAEDSDSNSLGATFREVASKLRAPSFIKE